MMFTKATNRSFQTLARDDFKLSQEQSLLALTPQTFYAQILMLRLMKTLPGLGDSAQDYVTYSMSSPSLPRAVESVLSAQGYRGFTGRQV